MVGDSLKVVSIQACSRSRTDAVIGAARMLNAIASSYRT
jgi:hypothetical protein